jgi:Tfp pilus assembly protein FimT
MGTVGYKTRTEMGFSVLELIVVIGVLAVMLGLATVAQSRLLPNYRLSAATRQLATDLRMLRAKAIAQNARFRMVLTANGDTYTAERWDSGSGTWLPYALYQRGSATSAATVPIDLPSPVTTTSATIVTFAPRGSVATTGALPILLSAPGPRTRALTVTVAGLISIS